MKEQGFTLFEVIIVLAIFAVLSAVVVGSFVVLQKRSGVDSSAQEFVNALKLAQSKTLASEQSKAYGVYINTSVSPHRYIIFRGATYASRETAFDQEYQLPSSIEFFGISLGGGNEIVFERLTGFSAQSGNVSVRFKTDTSQSKTIYIANNGTIGFEAPANPSDANRVKDSRHVHFTYSRAINTASENVVLTFNGITVQTIPIATNMPGGQFYWQGTVTAGGAPQTVEVRTHRLNDLDTQFSIIRDRRVNDKTFKINLSGDSSGSLAEYSANGATTNYFSIYVSNFAWQ